MRFMEIHMVIFTPYSAACKGKLRNSYKISVGKPDEKKPFGRLKNRWEDNIKTDIKEIWNEDVGHRL
jgi:hypothetical protein